ncbi:transposase [Streptomyces griseorubiginosus]|uniref:transposase n=1 Tax=Streptomyces griseorubiginosus TaxID=67304 RepID=UPI0036BE255B
MLQALIRGETDPQVLADLAKRRLRNKISELTEALTGRFREHHAFLTRLHLDQYDQLTAMIGQLDERIEEAMAPLRPSLDLLDAIPGINQAVAEVIIAETGADMSRFASARHLTSWAGVCPGHHESAGRTKSTKVRPGNPYLKGALGLAAFGAVRTKDTYLQARYKRLTAGRGPLRALVAVEHSITAIRHMLTGNTTYQELGGTYFTQRDPERAWRPGRLSASARERPDGVSDRVGHAVAALVTEMAHRRRSEPMTAETAGAATPHRRGPGRRAARAARRPVIPSASGVRFLSHPAVIPTRPRPRITR